jgi:hypothetical protein
MNFVSLIFFTGNSSINVLSKANWLNKGDNLGSKNHKIVDGLSFNQARVFKMKSYEIAAEW